MRITTNAILRDYKSNLGKSLSNLDIARTRVMTGRKFNSTAEDPSNALRAAVLERKYVKNQDYLNLVGDIQSLQDSQEDAAMQINNIAQHLSKQYGLEALNGTNGSLATRETYANAWRDSRENIILSLNASYEGKYVFAGSDGQNAPFSLKEVPDKNGAKKEVLLYRNVDVTTGELYTFKSDGAFESVSPDPNAGTDDSRLNRLSKDSLFVDLGFGLNIDNTFENSNGYQTKIDASSAFNTSLPGINMVGFGEKDNMILLMGQIADELDKPEFDYNKYQQLLEKFDSRRDDVLEAITTLGTKTEFLTTTKDRLETNDISLSEQIDNVVNIDMAEAIMNFSWAQYAYNASLKVGNNILTPSFIDFMS